MVSLSRYGRLPKYVKLETSRICPPAIIGRYRTQITGQDLSEQAKWSEPQGFDTGIVVYNPIMKRKVPLVLLNRAHAKWYMCGPTVYDSAHIGHACSYVKLDIIRRIMYEYFEIDSITVMGITDVDDKIINRAANSGIDWRELTQKYENQFYKDMSALNVQRPLLSCRVTDYIPDIIEFVRRIIDTRGAYVTPKGSVYFDTIAYKSYKKPDYDKSGPHSPDKRSSLDFALWKAAKPGEPFWISPWGPGRPGWHIECSTIASKVLGANLDIHSGGIDLAFPHHENEEAQSCCYHGTQRWVNYWLRTGHLCLKDTKMSKSLGNGISVMEFLDKYTANQFRLFCLQSHYRNGVDYTYETMESSVIILKKIESFLSDCDNYIQGTLPSGNVDQQLLLQRLTETRDTIRLALANDFDTPSVIRAMINLVSTGNKMLQSPESSENVRNPAIIAALASFIRSTLTKFGLRMEAVNTNQMSHSQLSGIVDSVVKFRQSIRNFALNKELEVGSVLNACDETRADLSLRGVLIKDHGKTSTWSFGEPKNA